MTAEDIEEEAPESVGASDPDEQRTLAKTTPDIEERDLGNSEVDISQLEERLEEEEHGVEDEGVIEQHGKADPFGDGEETKEGEEDCPFCLYMRSGACGESFADWEECVNEGEKAGEDVVEKCVRVTRLLTKCMRANADYYGPVLDAEKVMAASIASAGDGLGVTSKEKAEGIERETVGMGAQNAAREAEG